MNTSDLFETLTKLRLLAAVLYDQGTAAGLSEEEKEQSIEPIRHRRQVLIHEAMDRDLGEIVSAVKNYQELALSEGRNAQRHREKADEANSHAAVILDLLKAHMLSKGQTEKVQGNYMATIVDGKLEVR